MSRPTREDQVLELAAQGRTDAHIASELGVSVHTVDQYWRRVRARMGAASRTEAVAMVQKAVGERLKGELQAVEERIALAVESHRKALALCHSQQDRLLELVAMLKMERVKPEGFIFFDDEATFSQAYGRPEAIDLTPLMVPGAGLARPNGLVFPPLRITGGGDNPYRIVLHDWGESYPTLPQPQIQFDRPSGREGESGCLSIAFNGDVFAFGAHLTSRTRWSLAADAWRIEVESASHKAHEYALIPCSGASFFGVRCTEPLRRILLRPSENCYGMVGAISWAGVG